MLLIVMAFYSYKARTAQGSVQMGQREAGDSTQVVEELRRQGLMVLDVRPAKGKQGDGLPPRWHPAWLLPVTSLDIEFGLRQLASMFQNGVSILEALRTVAVQATRPRTRRIWLALEERIRGGSSVSDALEAYKGTFGQYIIQLVKVGEHSGEMDDSFARAAEHLELHRDIRMMTTNALIYPALTMLVTMGVSVYLVMVLIPKVSEFLGSSGAQLPAVTQMLVSFSEWMHLNGVFVFIGIAAAVATWFIVRLHPVGRDYQDAGLLWVPVAGKVLRLSQTAILARGLGMLIESGVTLLDALGILEALLTNRRMSRRVAESRAGVVRGDSLADTLLRAPEFMPMLGRMTAVAETTGTLGKTLSDVAKFYEGMLVTTIKRLGIVIEPVLIVITAGLVGFVYIAFFLALFQMTMAI